MTVLRKHIFPFSLCKKMRHMFTKNFTFLRDVSNLSYKLQFQVDIPNRYMFLIPVDMLYVCLYKLHLFSSLWNYM